MGGYSVKAKESDILYAANYGVTANGTTDDTAAFNSFMAACKAGSMAGELPKGTIRLASKPNDVDFAWNLTGKNTRLLRDYNEAVNTKGCLNITASGGKYRNFGIDAASGTTGGSLVSVISTAGVSLSDLVFEDMTNSTFGTDTHKYTMYIDGSAAPTHPMNDISLRNVRNYGGQLFSVVVKSVQEFCWIGGGVYAAGGSGTNSGSFDFTGVVGNKSYYTHISLESIVNALYLTQCEWGVVTVTNIGVTSGVSVYNANTCDYFKTIIARAQGTLQTLWTNSTHL